MVRTALMIAMLVVFCLPASTQEEVRPVVGKMAELILKYGDTLETKCGTKYKRRWKFCTSTVSLNAANDEVRQYAGMWRCMRYLNDNGDHLNIVCRRVSGD
ncbi:MAG: hypothetical protein VX884_00785 [Pseudomonadota bacterium]|nr:hypothetical protein [Pseudomonadota bacterium]